MKPPITPVFELIAQGPQFDHRWRRRLPAEVPVELGRATTAFRVPWDAQVSRRHVRMTVERRGLRVEKLDEAVNPVFYHGVAAVDFRLKPDDHFVIGKTTFMLTQQTAQATLDLPHPIRQKSFTSLDLNRIKFRDAEQRIDVLSRLPDLISSASNEQELMNRLLNTLMAGIESATAIGIVQLKPAEPDLTSTEPADASRVNVIHWDRRQLRPRRDPHLGQVSAEHAHVFPEFTDPEKSAARLKTVEIGFQPSETLIRQACETGETRLHVWQASSKSESEYTLDQENDWAFVCPLDSTATPGWGVYVTGSQGRSTGAADSEGATDEKDLQGDIKFCELVGSTLKNLLVVNQWERRQASLRSFFSPVVMEAIMHRDPEAALAPQEALLSVVFCDLKGFVKTSEVMAGDLFDLLNHVSQSLDVVTKQILAHGGVIGDFHGDAAMGFWGWPIVNEAMATLALKTALKIKQEFYAREPTRDSLPVGIGIATGSAVAGKIGTTDQVKITALGPVVNLASRLEGMNRILSTSILLDQATWQRHQSASADAGFGFRPLGKFQPLGIRNLVDVVQLLDDRDALEPSHLIDFATALQQFQSGDWSSARKIFEELQTRDQTAHFFLEYIEQRGNLPPVEWAGVVELSSK